MSDERLPQATHEGELALAGVRLRTYQLDDGRRVIHADDIHALVDALAAMNGPIGDELQELSEWLAQNT